MSSPSPKQPISEKNGISSMYRTSVLSLFFLFLLQRVNQCLRDACHDSQIGRCREFIDCGHGNDYSKFSSDPSWNQWKNDTNSIACFSTDGFDYGIYQQAVNLTTNHSLFTRYIYSLFWGFQVFINCLHH